MHPQDLAIVKGLVSVAWADGRVTVEEHEVIDALLEAYRATPSERLEVLSFAKEPRTVRDVPIHDLSYDDRRVLLQHAGLISWIDGEHHEKEAEVLAELAAELRIPGGEAKMLLDEAERRAKELREGT
jgi:tellurite resistance protein